MNYKDKIEALKEKGIFSQEQAYKLEKSFAKTTNNTVITRKYSLEMIGVALVVLISLYMFFVVGLLVQDSAIEDVSKSLNTPLSSGISSGSSFLLIYVLCIIGLYLFLYFLAHNAVNRFKSRYAKMEALKHSIKHTTLMEQELSVKLKNSVYEEKGEKDFTIRVDINNKNENREYAMRIYKELQERLKEEKDALALLEEKCQAMQDTFPSNLAKLIRSLPSCK